MRQTYTRLFNGDYIRPYPIGHQPQVHIPYAPRGEQPNVPIRAIQQAPVQALIPAPVQAPNQDNEMEIEMNRLHSDIMEGLDFIQRKINDGTIVQGDPTYNEWSQSIGAAMEEYNQKYYQPFVPRHQLVIGHGFGRKMKGRGIAVDHSIGVKPAIKFAPFGKYLLDMSKLKDDTIAMKTMSGTSVVGHPSKKVSTQFSKIVKDMIGGKVPSDEDLSGLSTLEREYLHKVSKKANIEDKFAVATPSKDQYEKDIHSFEVMRGEIVAGNDNQEMIKKFKLLIMKLSRSGSLPKNEVSEILSELAELGY